LQPGSPKSKTPWAILFQSPTEFLLLATRESRYASRLTVVSISYGVFTTCNARFFSRVQGGNMFQSPTEFLLLATLLAQINREAERSFNLLRSFYYLQPRPTACGLEAKLFQSPTEFLLLATPHQRSCDERNPVSISYGVFTTCNFGGQKFLAPVGEFQSPTEFLLLATLCMWTGGWFIW